MVLARVAVFTVRGEGVAERGPADAAALLTALHVAFLLQHAEVLTNTGRGEAAQRAKLAHAGIAVHTEVVEDVLAGWLHWYRPSSLVGCARRVALGAMIQPDRARSAWQRFRRCEGGH